MKRQTCVQSAIIILFLTINFAFVPKSFAQSEKTLKCGDIIKGEITQSEQNKLGFIGGRFGDTYILDIVAGTKVTIAVKPAGDTFNVGFALLDSAGSPVLYVNKGKAGVTEKLADFSLGSSKQKLVIFGSPPESASDNISLLDFNNGRMGAYFGAYEIRLGCTLDGGKIIEPGDAASPTSIATPSNISFSGVGFPGLRPVDFSKVAKIPLPNGLAMAGAITPTGNEILGYVFDGKANSTPELTFTRLSGNLNLGLVVLSDDNNVVYQASLVTSKTMTTAFTLPKDGKYTVGVFRIELLPPASPEATAFQIQVKSS